MRKSSISIILILTPGLLALGIVGCNNKAPTLGSLQSQTKGAESSDSEANDVKELGGSSDGTTSSDTVADNTGSAGPSTGDTSDDDVSPPVNTTGSSGDKKENDPDQSVPNGKYFIKSSGALKCLALPNNSRDNGAQLEQMTCDLKSNVMKFVVQYDSTEKAFSIGNVDSQKFLEVRNQDEVIQGVIQQNDYFGLAHQLFLIEKKDDGHYYIRTKTKKLFLDVTGASTADHARIQLWGDGNGVSSSWILEPTL